MYRTAGEQRLPPLNPHLVARKYVDVPAAYLAAALEDRVRSLATRPAGTPTTPIPARHSPPQRGHNR
ncbi:hypothetical protein [Streptomyces olivaceus]|uniref:hypothetical protein n=1 Tax=Streptomyces olivaceus TaxID=47716 RepID=UPI001D1710C6|nr:hypothetical protein [Streptomyces olivaceus]